MIALTISDFSCLKDATLILSPINVIIGPQGSGKSVTTKLLYFFSDIVSSFLDVAERGESLEDYKRQVSKQFCLWFPPAAWGKGRFKISYSCGNFSIRLLRRKSRGRLGEEVAVAFSEWFSAFYEQSRELFEQKTQSLDIKSNRRANAALERSWRIRELVSRRLAGEIGGEYITDQTFIPAGRAFFTSIGRLVAGFEQAGSLDPVTVKFARLFASIRDPESWPFSLRFHRRGRDASSRRNMIMNELFGGEIKFEKDQDFLETKDGRKIPFSTLSSGQQELLPIWSLVDYLTDLDDLWPGRRGRASRRARELIYIEEPEAHLFPSAQSLLMEFLISSIASKESRRNLIITTHSPYIMGKLNVFLKAGQLARRKKRNQEIHKVVPRECWLTSQQLSAFAIEDGKLRELTDDDGLIDGRYLDQISEDISYEFSRLLKIESGL